MDEGGASSQQHPVGEVEHLERGDERAGEQADRGDEGAPEGGGAHPEEVDADAGNGRQAERHRDLKSADPG